MPDPNDDEEETPDEPNPVACGRRERLALGLGGCAAFGGDAGWTSDDANSGEFLRCRDAKAIGDESCREANVFDRRLDQTHARGAIVKVAAVAQPAPRAGGRWNTFELMAQGTRLVVVLDGRKTVDVNDPKLAAVPFGLQWGRGW